MAQVDPTKLVVLTSLIEQVLPVLAQFSCGEIPIQLSFPITGLLNASTKLVSQLRKLKDEGVGSHPAFSDPMFDAQLLPPPKSLLWCDNCRLKSLIRSLASSSSKESCEAAKVISALAAESPQRRVLLREQGCIPRLVRLIAESAYPSTSSLLRYSMQRQLHGASALWNMAYNPQNKVPSAVR